MQGAFGLVGHSRGCLTAEEAEEVDATFLVHPQGCLSADEAKEGGQPFLGAQGGA